MVIPYHCFVFSVLELDYVESACLPVGGFNCEAWRIMLQPGDRPF